MAPAAIVVILAVVLQGCKRHQEAPAQTPETKTVELPQELVKAQEAIDGLKDETTLLKEQDAADRRELVTPAPPGFQPKAAGRHLELALTTRNTLFRKGDSFWFRADIRNVGSEPIVITDPFIKTGSGGNGWSKFRIEVTPKPRDSMGLGNPGEPCVVDRLPIKGWDAMSEEQKRAARKVLNFKETTNRSRVYIELKPGESVRTRDWRQPSREESCVAATSGGSPWRPGGQFREYEIFEHFSTPGTYILKLIYDDPGQEPRPDDIAVLKKLGRNQDQIDAYVREFLRKPALRAESSPVSIEVAPR